MQNIYIIPGFKQLITTGKINKLKTAITNSKLNPILYSVSWNQSTMTEWVKDFSDFYNENESKPGTTIIGFSFGALITLISYPLLKVKPHKLILCSLVPWFKEDMHSITKTDLKLIGKKRYKDFQNISINDLCPKIDTKVTLLYGSIEAKRYPLIQARIEMVNKMIKDSEIIRLEDVDHDIEDSKYQNTIVSLIK